MCRKSLHVALNFLCYACSHHSGSCVWSLPKGDCAVAVPGKHLAAAPAVLVFIDSAGSPVCPHVFNYYALFCLCFKCAFTFFKTALPMEFGDTFEIF